MPAAWAIAVAASVMGADLYVDGGVRVEGRSRTVDASGAERVTAVEGVARPQVAAAIAGPDGAVDGRYAPSVRAADMLLSSRTDVLHVADVGGRLRVAPAWSLRARAGAERGTTDLLAEARLRGAAPEAIPSTARLRFASARADLALDGTLDPRTTTAFTAGWFVGGGDDAESRAILPMEHGVRGSGRVEWNATRLDVLALQAAATGAELSDGREAGVVTLVGGWRHRVDPRLEVRGSAGGAAAGMDGRAQDRRTALLPVAEVGLAHASERLHLAEEGIVRLGTSLDRVSGTVDRTVEAEVSTRWAPAAVTTLALRALATFVQHETGDARRGSADVRLEHRLSPQLSFGLGLYASWQRTPDPTLPSFLEAGAFGSFAVELGRGPPSRP